jgi:transcriptional regulator with XRE-family HTH domain
MTDLILDTQRGDRRVRMLWLVPITPGKFKQFRKKLNESARVFGQRLGISRSYVKKIEGGSLAPSRRVEEKFRELQSSIRGVPVIHERVILSRFKIPDQVRLLSSPRRCRGHKRWMIFRTPQQVYCSKECERLWRRENRKGVSKRRKK